ncbi:uncharacterized protein LOC131875260 [Cryptomeria japonica]|uniref:uncharacterized protein LOC131875260 n=1 Tax=Cryptomeria japonica TaxID=3369 RepID=UPI0027DA7E96|nr:uncharacterized protein LOC131875260 [Cryptomeria japonica]
MEKYFGLRNMSNETKAVWASYQLSGEAVTWWDNEKSKRKLKPRDITWELFLQSFRKRWLPQLFFDKKMTEFSNLTQGGMSITQYWEKFTNLLKYAPQYQMDERFRIQKFILGLITHIGEEVDIHNPLTMEEEFTKEQQRQQSTNKESKKNLDRVRSGGNSGPRDGCYNYGGSHYASNCLQRTPAQRGENQQGASQHQIHVEVDNCQAGFQASPIQMTGKLFGQSVSILIDR